MLRPSTHSRYWNLSELRNIGIQIDVLVCSFVFVLIIVFFFFFGPNFCQIGLSSTLFNFFQAGSIPFHYRI